MVYTIVVHLEALPVSGPLVLVVPADPKGSRREAQGEVDGGGERVPQGQRGELGLWV